MAQMTATVSLTRSRSTSLEVVKALSHVCFAGGFASILVWQMAKYPAPSHVERFGILIGLWAPKFFALSDRRDRYEKGGRA